MDKTKVFVIMPFTNDFFESYEMLKRKLSNSYELSHAGEEDNQQNILADIIQPIYEADIVLADLTGLNPNVMYELGIAHTMCKKTIVITRDDLNTLPFDLKQYRAKDYSTHFVKFDDLITYLEKNFKGAMDGSVLFSNPVKDFMDKSNIDISELVKQSENNVTIIEGEKGFIDFIADIEENMAIMTDAIQTMISQQEKMNEGINECSKEMDRVNSHGGNTSASFARKQSKKAAKYIDQYHEQLRKCNETLFTKWEIVEGSINGLLENHFTSTSENRPSLINFLKQLIETKDQISESNKTIHSYKEAFLGNLGIERSLNRSIRFLESDLIEYTNGTANICNSIDSIISKSKFVVGNITLD